MTLTLENIRPSLLELIQTANRFSAAERLFLAKTLLDGLVAGEVEEFVDESPRPEDEAVTREREAYIALHPTLLKQYPNEHVAIYRGELVDHDIDALALSLRIYQRFPDQFVWIAPVKPQALEEWTVRSPRFEPMAS